MRNLTSFVRRIARTIDSLDDPIHLRGLGLGGGPPVGTTSGGSGRNGSRGLTKRHAAGVPAKELGALRRAWPTARPPIVFLATDSVAVEAAMREALGAERLVVQPSSSASAGFVRTRRGRAVEVRNAACYPFVVL